jgi:hypothetical protein
MKIEMENLTYGLEYYIHMFSPERWEEIDRVINNWVTPKLEDGRELISCYMNPETQILCFIGDSGKVRPSTMEYYQKKVLKKYLTPDELDMCNTEAVKIFQEKREKQRFEQAKKVPASEWNGPVFDDDKYYVDVDHLWDHYQNDYDWQDEDEDDDDAWKKSLPEYVYACIVANTLRYNDLDNMIEQIIEGRISGMDDDYYEYYADYDITEDLREAWNRFVDKYSHDIYEPSYNTVILLNK